MITSKLTIHRKKNSSYAKLQSFPGPLEIQMSPAQVSFHYFRNLQNINLAYQLSRAWNTNRKKSTPADVGQHPLDFT